jgi:hypothetical protein
VLGQCIAIKLSACAEQSGECSSVFGDAPADQDGRLAKVQGGAFDLPTKTATRTDLYLQVGMYGDGQLLATGEARKVSFSEDGEAGLTLFPVGPRTACAEPGGRSIEALRKRTFHTATLMPNGQVLIAGGVTGPLLRTDPDPNALGQSMEVLDPRSGAIEEVSIVNDAPDESRTEFFRAFHQAAYIGTDPEGRYTIRVLGGIRALGTRQSVLVSRTREGMPLQLLFSGAPEGPDEDAEPAPPVDIHYDPGARSATITDAGAETSEYPRGSFGGFAVLTDPDADPGEVTAGYYLGGGLGAWTEAQEQANTIPPVTGGFLISPTGGTTNATPAPLEVGRVGTAALGIGADEVLFWGGNVWSVEGIVNRDERLAALAAEIAEIHRPGDAGASAEFVPVTGLEVPSTAFHAAAVAAVDGDVYRIVVAGGYVVTDLEAVDTQQFAPVPLYLVSYDKAQRTAEVTAVDCGAADCGEVFGEVAYLTATVVTPGRVLLVGGNYEYDGPSRITYGARAVAGVVNVSEETATFEPVDLAAARYGHTATRLADGAVLILGGVTLDCNPGDEESGECGGFGDITPLNTYEVYNEGLDFLRERDCAETE